MQGNRRGAERLESAGLVTNLFDGRSAVLGVVEDISRDGIRVSTIPAAFEDAAEICYAVVNGCWLSIYLALQPRWVQSSVRGYKKVGFQILCPPPEWMNFVKEKEAELCADMYLAA